MLARLDVAFVDREKLSLGAGAVKRAAGLLQLDPLDAVSGQDRDLLALQFLRHVFSQNR